MVAQDQDRNLTDVSESWKHGPLVALEISVKCNFSAKLAAICALYTYKYKDSKYCYITHTYN